MLTVGNPFTSGGVDVPGSLPSGVYVAVRDDGAELAMVRLDLEDGPRWIREDEDGWKLGELVSAASVPDFVAALLDGRSATALAEEIKERATWGISPFGEGRSA